MEYINNGLAFLRGAGEGATAGLVHYPAAVAMLLADQTVGDGRLTYKNALRELKTQRASDIENYPVANIGGQVVGAVLPVGAAAKVLGTGWKTLAGIGAGTGAVQGFSQNDADAGTTLQDMGVGGAIGGSLSALGLGVTKVAGSAARKMVESDLYKLLSENKYAVREAKALLKKNGQVVNAEGVDDIIRKWTQQKLDATHPADWGQHISKPNQTKYERLKGAVAEGFSGVVPAATSGAVLGAISSPFTGIDPLTSAAGGAAGAVALAKQQAVLNAGGALKDMSARYLATSPKVLAAPALMGGPTGNIIAPQVVRTPVRQEQAPKAVPPAPADFSDLEEFRVKTPAPSAPASSADPYADLEEFRVQPAPRR